MYKGWLKQAGAGFLAAAVLMLSGGAVLAEEETQTQLETVQSAASREEALVRMSTKYPGVTVKAGSQVSFPLDFASLDGEGHDAALSAKDLPKGWTGYFKGGSNEVTHVHVSAQTEPEASAGTAQEELASYSLTLPEDAKEGTYTLTLAAEDEAGQLEELTLQVTVNEQENGASTLTAEYPKQQGAAGTTFTFNTTIVNNRGADESFALSANAPEGWQVGFTPSGESTKVTTLDVEAGGSKVVAVAITPPEAVEKGDYTIDLSAVSASDSLSAQLDIDITGSYAVELSTADGRMSFDAYANKEASATMTVTNTGNVDLENLNLNSSLPTGWEATFSESTIDLLEAGASKEVTVTVKPAENVITGDYVNSFTVSNDVVKTQADFRVSVKTPTAWGYVAVGIIVVLAVLFGAVIKKFGRR